MSGIITSLSLADKPELGAKEIKSLIVIKLLKDYGLNKDTYFNARVVIDTTQSNNFIQNKTYCINRYYKKNLGIGPRLGGSLMQCNSNKVEGPPIESNKTFMFISVLKDEEKLNKPYENVNYSGLFANHQDVYGTIQDLVTFNHEFSKSDLPGQFKDLGEFGGYRLPYSKKYIEGYYSYLIKNLDEHDYEYYQKLKLSVNLNNYGVYNFSESNDNVDLTFGSYE
jgi:hypothetical protein